MCRRIPWAGFLAGSCLCLSLWSCGGNPLPTVTDDPDAISWGSEELGIMEPASYHQRYRRDEFPIDKTFFQWWFFSVRDIPNNRHFAFTYYLLDCVEKLERESSHVHFSITDEREQSTFYKYEVFPLESLRIENDFDLRLDADGNNSADEFRLDVIDDDTYRIRGQMQASTEAVIADGIFHGETVDPQVPIQWDLTLYRIYGWYGQEPLESSVGAMDAISWNTYAHAAEVEGTITVGDEVYVIERNENFRAYGDQNWGVQFPRGAFWEDDIDYPWNWYYVGRPSADLEQELSIIAGAGKRHELGQGIMEAKFADIRLNAYDHLEVAGGYLLKSSPSATGFPIVSSNDGKVARYDIEYHDWAEYTDRVGSSLIPLRQKITIETENHLVELDFYSELEDYVRLYIAHEDYMFSDFEALGVRTHVLVQSHWTTQDYRWWDRLHLFPYNVQKHFEPIEDFWTEDGGLEYGYRTSD